MPHIDLPDLPGILGPIVFSPETAKPLNELAEVLLRGENTLTSGERELIAAYVSYNNDCLFCHSSHGAAAAHHLGDPQLVQDVKRGIDRPEVSPKLKALLGIAARVRVLGKEVADSDIQRARDEGATDKEIHDTVLIAAAFCMYNRYVDGLATLAPESPDAYTETGRRLAEDGYGTSLDELGERSAARGYE